MVWLAIWNIWFSIITSFLNLSFQSEICFQSTTTWYITQGVLERLGHYYTCGAWGSKASTTFSKGLWRTLKTSQKHWKRDIRISWLFILKVFILKDSNLAPLQKSWSAVWRAVRRWMKLCLVLCFHNYLGQKLWHRVSAWDVCMFWCWKWDAVVQQDCQCYCKRWQRLSSNLYCLNNVFWWSLKCI